MSANQSRRNSAKLVRSEKLSVGASKKARDVIDKIETFFETLIKKQRSEKRQTIEYLDMGTDDVMCKGMHIA